MVYVIDGYWVDDGVEFKGYLVNEFEDVPKGYSDEDIFYYGLSESAIQKAIELKGNAKHDFVITSYKEEQ